MSNRHDLRLEILLELVDNLVLGDRLDGFFDLQKRMLVLDLLLAVAAEIEVVAEDALVADAQDAELVLAVRADDFVDQELFLARRGFSFEFELSEYLGSGGLDHLFSLDGLLLLGRKFFFLANFIISSVS